MSLEFFKDTLDKKQTTGCLIKYFVTEKIIFQIKYPSEIFGLEEQNGGNDKEPLLCPGHGDANVF